jgi:DNA primase large subunit
LIDKPDITIFAKYPFLNESREYIKKLEISVEELLQDIAYERARDIGLERVENALKRGDVGNRSLASEADCIMELLSYPIARMICVCVNEPYLKRRYALGEAIHFYKYLQNEDLDFLLKVANELNMDVKTSDSKIKIYFVDYLKNAPTRYQEWKLVNRVLDKGYVYVNRRELTRIIEENLRNRIIEELDSRECNEIVKKTFHKEIESLKNAIKLRIKKAKTRPIRKVSITRMPPCMKKILSMIQSGENVPHMARFALVAFLNSLDLNFDEILDIFRNAPDYEEDKTRYQIEHITGRKSSTEYVPPGCDKMRTYGICPVEETDTLCKKINHPLTYYKLKWQSSKGMKK